ncbi:4-hydroxythreonine-4-phosphate dehydrogenase PdxA [Arthrobacter sp. SO3]|uniref:4-hydroxythreonine-4-phosphate dehydrogenase PdxA n=1 Tax=Arthrobacter sp. SO3 TaxID=1897057 RepID=UPI001CFFF763|nr:4-hydroxythreonine-4-phosphate dehydrogenase PdxA [Arthrobacter sp. SO3]
MGAELEKIIPAVKELQAYEIKAIGPLPVDTTFFLAGRGDYDLIGVSCAGPRRCRRLRCSRRRGFHTNAGATRGGPKSSG